MNWKINYWTVLFALLLAGLGYNSCVSENQTTKEDDPPIALCTGVSDCSSNGENFKILTDTATNRIVRYNTAMAAVLDTLIGSRYPSPVNNFVLNYVKLPRCEMYQMLCEIPDGDVYIYPTIEYNERTGEPEFSAILGDSPYIPGQPIDGIEQFFDFGKPCPNACPPKK